MVRLQSQGTHHRPGGKAHRATRKTQRKNQSPRLPITKTANTTQQLCGRHGTADRRHHHRHLSVHSRWWTSPSSLAHTERRRPPAQYNYRRLNFRRRRLPSFHLHYERPLPVEKSNWPTHRCDQVIEWYTVMYQDTGTGSGDNTAKGRRCPVTPHFESCLRQALINET